VRWRLIDLAQWIFEEFRIAIAKQTLSRELRAMGYRKLSARPRIDAYGVQRWLGELAAASIVAVRQGWRAGARNRECRSLRRCIFGGFQTCRCGLCDPMRSAFAGVRESSSRAIVAYNSTGGCKEAPLKTTSTQ
jgi:Winged helix-turn helix